MKLIEKNIIDFLKSFFSLFETKTENIKFDKETITGFVVWEDEDDKQEFSWEVPTDDFDYSNITELVNFIDKNQLMKGDMIDISKDLLVTKLKSLGWDLTKINKSIDSLCSIRIAMIDDGEISDYFLIHF